MADVWHKDPKLTAAQIKWLLTSFYLLIVALILLYGIGSYSAEGVFDFLSYLLPCVAGALAGAGLFARSNVGAPETERACGMPGPSARPQGNDEKAQGNASSLRLEQVFYAWSVFALYVGVLFYVMAHRTCRAAGVYLCALSYLLPVGVILLQRLSRRTSGVTIVNGALESVMFTSVILVVILFALAGLFYGVDTVIPNGHLFLCT
ncbi:hypothetical protein [Dyella sp.]|uniref:hypothetical protein n=1 Tax=Dyella sp. TaxID=1869338 RepID=UPI002ED67B94